MSEVEWGVEAVARVLLRHYESEFDASHLSWHHFIDDAREVIAALDLPARDREQRAAALARASAEMNPITNPAGTFSDVHASHWLREQAKAMRGAR